MNLSVVPRQVPSSTYYKCIGWDSGLWYLPTCFNGQVVDRYLYVPILVVFYFLTKVVTTSVSLVCINTEQNKVPTKDKHRERKHFVKNIDCSFYSIRVGPNKLAYCACTDRIQISDPNTKRLQAVGTYRQVVQRSTCLAPQAGDCVGVSQECDTCPDHFTITIQHFQLQLRVLSLIKYK